MRFFIETFIILLSMLACSQSSKSGFVDKVTNDFSRNSYFIFLNVRLPEGITTSLIENDDLYYFFHKTKGYDEAKYKEDVGVIINKSKALSVAETDFSKFGFTRLVSIPKFKVEAKKGKDFIMGKYFKDHVIIDGIMEKERNALIRLLFDWNIPSKIDDETGYLIIEN